MVYGADGGIVLPVYGSDGDISRLKMESVVGVYMLWV